MIGFISVASLMLAVFGFVWWWTWPRAIKPSGRVVVRGDSSDNPRFRWYLVDDSGRTIAMCTGSFAEAVEADRAANEALRVMRCACR